MSSRHISLVYLGLIVTLGLTLTNSIAASAPDGRWSGSIKVPGSPVEIEVNLARTTDSTWRGAIDIPAQGLNAFPLTDIEVEGRSVAFSMSGIPGEPLFKGELSPDGASMSGKFTQGGSSFPFDLANAGEAQLAPVESTSPIAPEVASDLAGRWEGNLRVQGRSMRIVLALGSDSGNGLTATLDSPDQGQTGMPVTRLTVEGSTLRAELVYAGAAYEGTLNETMDEMSGTWQQGGASLPLSLRKAEEVTGSSPEKDPQNAGLPAGALDTLVADTQSMVDHEEIVGGELMVIKDGRSVLREAFGWNDRKEDRPMEVGALYCVRSMTKPLVGTAIQMLIDEGKLSLTMPVHTILPSFAGPMTKDITLEHLLTHTSGLPFSTFKRGLADYADLAEVAAEAAQTELLFEPGSRFQYSDAGSDTLGAIVEAVTGMSVERFIQTRILEPLGMKETVTLLGENPEITRQIPSAYSGGTGAWTRHWSPSDPPIFPLFLTSQSLYSTTADYAKFLALWLNGGEIDGKRLLSSAAIERALSPAQTLEGYPKGADGSEMHYGQQWMIRMSADGNEPRRVMFGHDGSDGTHAWAWPEQDLIVLFFTQSRGTLSGVGLERRVEELIIERRPDELRLAAEPAEKPEQYAGLYWDEDEEFAYYVVTPRGDRLEIDRPGGGHMVFKPGDTAGRFVHESNPQVWIEFVRGGDGRISEMQTYFGKRIEHDPRHVADSGLPSVDEVIGLVRQAHRIDKLESVGVVRLSGSLRFIDRNIVGSVTTTLDETRSRTEVRVGSSRETVMIDGDRAWSDTTTTGIDELSGRAREQEILGGIPVLLGDWRRHYEHIEVLKRVEVNGQTLILVRLVPREGPGYTMFVDEDTGLVFRRDALLQVPGIGIVGVQTLFQDVRDVEGMRLPFRITSRFQNELIGRVVTEIDRVKIGVKVSRTTFRPRAAK